MPIPVAEALDLDSMPAATAVARRLELDGATIPDGAAELLLGPVLHRWPLRNGPFDDEWIEAHVGRAMRGMRVHRREMPPTFHDSVCRRASSRVEVAPREVEARVSADSGSEIGGRHVGASVRSAQPRLARSSVEP